MEMCEREDGAGNSLIFGAGIDESDRVGDIFLNMSFALKLYSKADGAEAGPLLAKAT